MSEYDGWKAKQDAEYRAKFVAAAGKSLEDWVFGADDMEFDYHNAAVAMIEKFEGFISHAAWDVNAYRLGFGSDTEGPEQRRVTRDMTTTLDRARMNLLARLPHYEKVIASQIGHDRWAKVPPQAKPSFLSIAYNYGKLPFSVAQAMLGPDPLETAAKAIIAHGSDNKGVNKKRRTIEASYIKRAIEAGYA